MKEKITSASEQCCEPPKSTTSSEKTTDQETKCVQGNDTITYSELLTAHHDCPLSSVLNLPLSKGVTGIPTSSISTAALHPPGQHFIPMHYPYPQEALKQPDQAMVLSDAFGNQELTIQNSCNPHAHRNTPYFPANRLFEMKENPSFHGVEIKPGAEGKESEVFENKKQHVTRMTRISLPIRELLKSGEHSRKRQRMNNDVVKSALQRKMEHLDKEKERRLRQTKCYDYLRGLVPCGSQKTDKANILEATVSYLTYIKETLGTTMEVIDKNFLDDFERNKESSE